MDQEEAQVEPHFGEELSFSSVLTTANCRHFAGGGAGGAPPWYHSRDTNGSCSLIEVHGWHDGNPNETRRQAEERDLLTDVIENPNSAGIFVKAVVCDQGASNCTLARRLGGTPDHPSFLVSDTQPATMPEPLPAIKTDEFDLPDE
ncbi:hypothetical protein HPB47_012026 [Ixodes persulcatus]|uniref:Uncharacterized protein n=1 Tax=Ixodes persulcatus TaxID=34615 RepID=A0AC60NUR7_IXOPE|nr:hypothetical protein HPB47_012026 [Ixodes persulcatus]